MGRNAARMPAAVAMPLLLYGTKGAARCCLHCRDMCQQSLICVRCCLSYHVRTCPVRHLTSTQTHTHFLFCLNLTYSRWTSSLTPYLWSLRIFPSHPVHAKLFFIAMQVQQSYNSSTDGWILLNHVPTLSVTEKNKHKSYFGKNRTHDFRTSRCEDYLLGHSCKRTCVTPQGTKAKLAIAERGQKVVGAKRSNSRENTMVVTTTNAPGTTTSLLIIFKGQRVQAAWLWNGGPPGSKIAATDSSFMQGTVFANYIADFYDFTVENGLAEVNRTFSCLTVTRRM